MRICDVKKNEGFNLENLYCTEKKVHKGNMSHKIQKRKLFFKIKTKKKIPREENCMWIQNYLFFL